MFPKLPSYNIVDLARAVVPECELDIIGIRPGEKIHEEMISKPDALTTVEFDNYFTILPSYKPALINKILNISNDAKLCDPGFSYNSGGK